MRKRCVYRPQRSSSLRKRCSIPCPHRNVGVVPFLFRICGDGVLTIAGPAKIADLLAKPEKSWTIMPLLELVQEAGDSGDQDRSISPKTLSHEGDHDTIFRVSGNIIIRSLEKPGTRHNFHISILCTPKSLRFEVPDPLPNETVPFTVGDYEFLDANSGVDREAQKQAVRLLLYFARASHDQKRFSEVERAEEWGKLTIAMLMGDVDSEGLEQLNVKSKP